MNESGAVRMAEASDPPAPIRSPPSVVEPVPPKATERVVVPLVSPVLSVKRREFCTEEIIRFVVEAVPKYPEVAVSAVEDAYVSTDDEAAREIGEPVSHRSVLVALVICPL